MKGWYLAERHLLLPVVCAMLWLGIIWSIIPYIISNIDEIWEDTDACFAYFILIPGVLIALVYLWLWPTYYQTAGKLGRSARVPPSDVLFEIMMWLRENGIEYTQYAELKTMFLKFYYKERRIDIVFKPSFIKGLGGTTLVGPRKAPETNELITIVDNLIADVISTIEWRKRQKT